ncbi:MAG: HypC/HybG/HupF family hydrogenase formation chaperone [Desulfobulbus sp.]|nr:HypC/HybG/HupF family hydrogenase formation chaperone [Desulfobulbus sp.]
MCLSIPMRVEAWEGDGEFAWVARGDRRERINMMLLGPQPVGAWVLISLGLAREVVEPEQLALIEEALTALAASLDGDYDASGYFRDLEATR